MNIHDNNIIIVILGSADAQLHVPLIMFSSNLITSVHFKGIIGGSNVLS